MNLKISDKVAELLEQPDKLLEKKPFTRGLEYSVVNIQENQTVSFNGRRRVSLPMTRRKVVTQEQFMRELDPECHTVLFDENIPSICIKTSENGFQEIQSQKMAIPFQRMIKNKRLLHLTARPMNFTLTEKKPTEQQRLDFITFKHYWEIRNQDGMKVKMVDAQLSYGDAGLLYYFDAKGQIKSRLLSYADGYVICSHNDGNGDRLLECIYYRSGESEIIDCYDENNVYRLEMDMSDGNGGGGWKLVEAAPHGFDEIPLITKRGDVAWNDVQSSIESYETLYNVFNTIQKRWGWGILYVKGKIGNKGKKLAGNIVLNDTSIDGKGDAKFLTPPSPEGTVQTLDLIEQTIQKGSGCTFILPKDIHTSSDVTGVAVKMTQSLDIQSAHQSVIEWQNVADKMTRLFKQGLAIELSASGKQPTAVRDFENCNIHAEFDIWTPYSENEYNTMLCTMKNSGVLSQETAIEMSTIARPDEVSRVQAEAAEATRQALELSNVSTTTNQNDNEQ